MQSTVLTTIRELEAAANKFGEVAVAYSGGKDSLVVMDLCRKTFPKVTAFFKHTVPGLEVEQVQVRFAKSRWGVDVLQYPHEKTFHWLRRGIYCDASNTLFEFDDDKIPLKWAFARALELTGSPVVATGMKDSDGLKRRQFFANIRDGGDPIWNRVIHPIRRWRKKDVLDYLRVNKIPLPETPENTVTFGVGLDPETLCWLHDKHPDDFARLERWFPYIGAAVKRRDWFGICKVEDMRDE